MNKPIIAVFGATGQQGGGVVQHLLAQQQFAVRAITRNPDSSAAQALAERGVDVRAADLNDSASLDSALQGVYGVFLVTNFWDPASAEREYRQVEAAVQAAQRNDICHFVWSTLPDVHTISNGQFKVPHFSEKARANTLVSQADFKHHSFVEAPFFFQNFLGSMAPQPLGENNLTGWTIPMTPSAEVLHAGDISELGKLVAAVFAAPEQAGHGELLAFAAGTYSWQALADVLNAQGHNVVVNQAPGDTYDSFYPGASEVREMMGYFEQHSYFGPQAAQKCARANDLLAAPATDFASWARQHMPA